MLNDMLRSNDMSPQAALTGAIRAVRQAQQGLMIASRQSTNQTVLLAINNEYQHLDSLLSQLFNAQAARDDVILDTASVALQAQARSLRNDEATIAKMIGDERLAAQIIGYVTRAATFLACR